MMTGTYKGHGRTEELVFQRFSQYQGSFHLVVNF